MSSQTPHHVTNALPYTDVVVINALYRPSSLPHLSDHSRVRMCHFSQTTHIAASCWPQPTVIHSSISCNCNRWWQLFRPTYKSTTRLSGRKSAKNIFDFNALINSTCFYTGWLTPCASQLLDFIRSPFSCDRQHLSYGDCLEVRVEIIRTVLCCIVYWKLCTVISLSLIHIWRCRRRG